ncbi:hypothetical protein B0J13DRAFT_49002 [Dactylonectria estremocensis]|uniref:Uncharacterized protein n=1 Tax=Dactylonectria estremocensis TaxID=1079267 RepID=A0A9P9EQV6_9HYPO|nr:hypothetical protein B0J13DRAFT_49002 [Dactylonectria estremocensis]
MADEEAALLFFLLKLPYPPLLPPPHDPIPWIFSPSLTHLSSVTRCSFARSLNPAIVGQSLSYPLARSLTIIAFAPSASWFASWFTSLIPFLVPGPLPASALPQTRSTRLSVNRSCITITTSSLSQTSFTSLTRAALLFHFSIIRFCLHKDFATLHLDLMPPRQPRA